MGLPTLDLAERFVTVCDYYREADVYGPEWAESRYVLVPVGRYGSDSIGRVIVVDLERTSVPRHWIQLHRPPATGLVSGSG